MLRRRVSRRTVVNIVVVASLLLAGLLLCAWLQKMPSEKPDLAALLGNPRMRQRAFEALMKQIHEEAGLEYVPNVRIERVLRSKTSQGRTIYVVLTRLFRRAGLFRRATLLDREHTLVLFLVTEEGNFISTDPLLWFDSPDYLQVLDLEGNGCLAILGLPLDNTPGDAYSDRVAVYRVAEPLVPLVRLSFEGGGGRVRVRQATEANRRGIEFYESARERVLLRLWWDEESRTFVPAFDSGRMRWCFVPLAPAPQDVSDTGASETGGQ